MAAPIYLKRGARRGPTWREVVLVHAIARIVYDGLIDNVQASWVKLGLDGVRQLLQAGVNDVGGTLMDENISRAAGAAHGQQLDERDLDAVVQGIGRRLRRRTTNYLTPPTHQLDEMIDLVNQKKVDIAMSLITPTLERAQKVRFTRPYLYLHQALLYNRLTAAKDKITDPANQPEKLAGLKIGLLKSSTYVQYSKQNFPNADYVYYENMADVMNDVKQGKLFAAFSRAPHRPT